MWHIYTMEYYAAIKRMSLCPLQGHEESGNHHSQQTDTRVENQTLHVLTHKRVLNNEKTWTQWGITHWGLFRGARGGKAAG